MTDNENNADRCVGEKNGNAVLPKTLYLVATPIGNLGDLSPRAVSVLSQVDFIAAEDTRNTLGLLTHFGIKKPLVSYYEHNKRERGEEICGRILGGESCALVTDAGMPAISDPGEDIVALCAEKDIITVCVPGACAAVTALAVSGLPTGRFCFEGFVSVNRNERDERLTELRTERRTMIFYEAPHKLKKTLSDMYAAFGDRRVTLCRELTKLHEQIIRTTFSEAVKLYGEAAPRGEYVLVVEGASPENEKPFWEGMSIQEHVAKYTDAGMTKNEAIKTCAHDRGLKKNDVYKLF